jgi:hypothetical protein
MLFIEDQDMIQAFAAKRPDQTFNIWVLPGRARCDQAVAYPHPSHPVREGLSVSTIIVADQIARRRIPRECLGDLPCSHSAVGCLVTANQRSCRRPWLTTRKANKHSNVRVGTRQRSIPAIVSAWLRRNVRHVCDGGPGCLIMYLETVDSATSKPSLSSSPWMRGAPHNGFSLLICRMRSRNSRSIFGRPARCRDPAPESFEPSAMPAQDRLRLHHLGQDKQIGPNPLDPYQ